MRESPDTRHLTRWVAHTLRRQIVSGELAPGDKLPSQKALEMRFKVSTVTVRNAVEELEDEGLIAKRQGAHTQVHDREPVHRLVIHLPERLGDRPVSFVPAEPPRRDVRWLTAVERVPVDRRVAALLQVAEGEQAEWRTFTLLDGEEPVLTSTSYLPLALAEGSPVPPAPAVEVGQLALTSLPVSSVELALRARMPDPAEFERLAMVKGTPVQVLTHRVLVGDGREAAVVPAAVEVLARADRVFVHLLPGAG